jgi:hypothetical protein
VVFDRNGKLTLSQGVARKKDFPQSNSQSNEGKIDSDNSQEVQRATISQALRTDLGRHRQQAVKAAL